MEYKVFTHIVSTDPGKGKRRLGHDELLTMAINTPLGAGFQFLTLLGTHTEGDVTHYKCLYVKLEDAQSITTG